MIEAFKKRNKKKGTKGAKSKGKGTAGMGPRMGDSIKDQMEY